MKKYLISILTTIIFGGLYFYIILPPLNITSPSFWFFVLLLLIVYLLTYTIFCSNEFELVLNSKEINIVRKNKYKKNKITIYKIVGILIPVIIFSILIINFILSPIFRADIYKNRITINDKNKFTEDIKEVDFNKIPLLDKDSTQKLGDRKMGEMPEYVSQYSVSDLYTQINYKNEIIRVTPLEYNGFIKYLTNKDEGIKGYITVDSVKGTSSLIKLDKGIKYTDSAYFNQDLNRKLRLSYPTKIFGKIVFELDEEGEPYFITPCIKYDGVGIKAEIEGIITLNAITGKTKYYNVKDVPKWVDRVYSPDLIINQVDDWGNYVNGFLNSIFGQKNVVNTTEGYNYLILNDDVYLYTGITSVAADESNLGFILVNLRTKEANYYNESGAEEFSAMSSAQGLVQEKGYVASFPLLINLNSRPTYLLSLKDSAGLVKMYAFVDVEDYQIVSTTESSLGIKKAAEEYLKKIDKDDTNKKLTEKEIKIKNIKTATIDGTSYYYITDTDNNKYRLSINVDKYKIPFIEVGDKLNIKYTKSDISIIKDIK